MSKTETEEVRPPDVANLHKGNIEETERRRRQAAFARAPGTILLKIFAMRPYQGVTRVQRDQKAVMAAQDASTRQRGLDPEAYGRLTVASEARVEGEDGRTELVQEVKAAADAGVLLFEKQTYVFSSGLVAQLEAEGYVAHDVHWFQQPGKGNVTVVAFRKLVAGEVVEAVEIPAVLRADLEDRSWNNGTVWLNPTSTQPDGRWDGRLDTINLAKGIKPDQLEGGTKTRRIEKHGNSYRLVPDRTIPAAAE